LKLPHQRKVVEDLEIKSVQALEVVEIDQDLVAAQEVVLLVAEVAAVHTAVVAEVAAVHMAEAEAVAAVHTAAVVAEVAAVLMAEIDQDQVKGMIVHEQVEQVIVHEQVEAVIVHELVAEAIEEMTEENVKESFRN
jgi:hypothetical protein